MPTTVRGGCHCGNLGVVLESERDPRTLPLRACQCSFCRRHGAVTTADARGLLRVTVADEAKLVRYRFALGITEFLVCRACGVYVAAIMPGQGGTLAVVNVHAFDDPAPFARPAEPMDYGAETAEERTARRVERWMPVTGA
jgi:hypothetical protein